MSGTIWPPRRSLTQRTMSCTRERLERPERDHVHQEVQQKIDEIAEPKLTTNAARTGGGGMSMCTMSNASASAGTIVTA